MMSIDRSAQRQASIVAEADSKRPGVLRLHVRDDSLATLGIKAGTVLEAERGRQTVDGDLIWVELVRRGTLMHLLRRYSACEGVVTLADPAGLEPSIIRQSGETQIRAVVTTPVGYP
jgi:hypothetical protein